MTNRGFTDHEHLDDAQLIHMNGRVYDYNLGRFLSVDPFIQAPGNSQSMNPYSYIMNNPLAGTDPSGYAADIDQDKLEVKVTSQSRTRSAPTGSRIKRDTSRTITATVTDESGKSSNYVYTAARNGSESAFKITPIALKLDNTDLGSKGQVGVGTSGKTKPDMTIKGFDNDRYNKHDQTIIDIVKDINASKADAYGATEDQAKGIPDLDPRLVKAWMIQESGGNDKLSKAAWDVDPLQANAYKLDWDKYKPGLGLKKSEAGAGNLKTNLRAGVIMMVRKGFGISAQPPSNRTSGTFDGFSTALQRYNGRTALTTNGSAYSTNYSNRIMQRYTNINNRMAISLPQPL
ncbi:MAG: RHS repeat-associated core domain-containing protein [Enterobacterales bacterium]|nr:RHS repeat-associated core domain-containing protein [Enterobacterales bacterium]